MNTTKARYEVGIESPNDYAEALSFHPRFFRAIWAAIRESKKHTSNSVYIYDRMARIGEPQLWYVEAGRVVIKERRIRKDKTT